MEHLKLENQLCFRLYKLNKLTTRLYAPLLKSLQLTYSQYLVMLVLWQQDTLSVKAIGSKLDLDSGTLSPLLKRLEKLCYITRIRSTEDERHVQVSLTKQGKELRVQAQEIPEEMFATTGLSKKELLNLMAQLDKITTHMSS